MLLRIVVLLFLCMSVVMCATIGHYQAQASVEEEEEAPASTDGAAAAVGAAKEDEAATDAKIGDSPAAEETVAKTLSDDKLPVDNPAAVKPEVNVLAVDRAAVEEPGTDSDGPERDATAMEALAEEAATQELPSSEEEGNEIRPVKTHQSVDRPLATEDSSSWSLNSIRNSFQTMHGYFDSLVELVGGHNGVCHYRCKYGEVPQSRPGYQHQEPNGCSSSLLGLQLDLGIPAMTKCCNELDVCYDTCGTNKYECDTKFQSCLHGICSDLKRSLGFVSKVQACESMADGLFNTVWTLGCRPYMNSQRAACVCNGEERDEL